MLTTPAPNASPSTAAGTPPSSIPRFSPFYLGPGPSSSVQLKTSVASLQQSQQNSHVVLGHNSNNNITNHSHNNTDNNNLAINNNTNLNNINNNNSNYNLSQQRNISTAAGFSGLPTLGTAETITNAAVYATKKEGSKCLTTTAATSNNNHPPSFEHLPLTNPHKDIGNNKSTTNGGGDSSASSLANRSEKDKRIRPTATEDDDRHSVTTNNNINNNRHKSFCGVAVDLAAKSLIPQTSVGSVTAKIDSSSNKVLLSTLRTKSLPSCNLIGPSRLATPSNWKENSLYQSQQRQQQLQSPVSSITHLPRPSTISVPYHLKTNSTHQLNGSNAVDNLLGLSSTYASPTTSNASKLKLVKTQSLGFNEDHRHHNNQPPNNNKNNIGNLLSTKLLGKC